MRYIFIVALAHFVSFIKIARAHEDYDYNYDSIESVTKNELTTEEQFIKSWGNYIGLWSFLVGIYIVPFFITMAIAPYMGRQLHHVQGDRMDMMTKMKLLYEISQKFNVKDPICRKRFICEIANGKLNPGFDVTNTSQTISDVRYGLPWLYQRLMNEFRESMKVLKDEKSCSAFASCSYSIARQF